MNDGPCVEGLGGWVAAVGTVVKGTLGLVSKEKLGRPADPPNPKSVGDCFGGAGAVINERSYFYFGG